MKGTLVAYVAAALALAATPSVAQVKIGFLAELSGPQGALGQDMYDGFVLGIEHASGKLGGQAVEVIREDSQLKPDVGIQIIQKFIQRDKVDIVTGVTFSNVMMAVARPLAEAGMIFVGSNAGPAPLAGAQCNRNFFFTSWQNDMQAEVMGKYAVDKGYRRVYLMAPNYQAGKDFIAGFKRFYTGEIVDEVYTQLGQPDYSAEITQLVAASPDSVFVFYPGGMGVNFVKQYKQAGLIGKIPLLSTSTTDGSTLPGLGVTAVGVLSGTFWGPDFANPASRKFVEAFERKHNRVPSQYAAQAYDAAMLLDSAIRKAGGAKDRDKLRAALRAADFKSVRGAFRFNSNNFPIQDMHVFEVVPDSRWNVNLKTVATPLKAHKDGYYTQCPNK
jgi:branched-chain amino acid transport system substrate-binding protein